MKKLAYIVLLALASNGVLAGEVGAPNPQTDTVAVELAAVVVDPGTSSNWATEPFEDKATVHQIKELNDRIETLNTQINTDIEAKIAEKLSQTLQD